MSKKLLSALIASLFAAAPAFGQSADDPMRVQGTATLGGIHNNTSATDNAQLDLYQDLGNGVMSNVGVQGRNSTTWFQGYGENFGRGDQYMFLRGGVYDVFKSGVYLNDIPRTFSSNAYTPYSGSGGNLLTATFPLAALPSNPPTGWNSFRLGYDRRDAGGYAEWQKNSPWYFRADGNQVTFSGTRVGSAANGTSPGNGYTDLAIPQDFKTSNWGAEGGYQSSKATFAVRWDYSKFENANETLRWTNPFFGPTVSGAATTSNQLDTTYLAPGNTFNKFTVSGNYRDLPWQSVLSARYTWAKTTSDTPLGLTALNTNGVYNNTLPDETNFSGENVNQSFALAWTAMPAPNFNTASTTTGRSCRTNRTSSSTATRRRSRSFPAWVAATTCRTGIPSRPSATARTSSTTTRRTTSASTRGGNSRPASAWASAGTTTTSTRRASTTTSRMEQAVGRVQEHDVRHAVRPAQVPVPEARLDAELQQQPASQRGREQPELPAAVHVGIRPAEQHHEPGEAHTRLEPDDERRRVVRGQLGQGRFRRRDLRSHQVRPAGLLPERLLERVRQGEAQRVRQLGGSEVSVEPPLHRYGLERQRHGSKQLAARILHDHQPELLRPVRHAESQQLLQLEFADQGQDVD